MSKRYESKYNTVKKFSERQNLPQLEDAVSEKQLHYAEINRVMRLCEAYYFIMRETQHRTDEAFLKAFIDMASNRSAQGWAASCRTSGVQMLLSYLDNELPDEHMLSRIDALLESA